MDFTVCLLPHLPKLTGVELGYNCLDHLSDEPAEPIPLITDTKLSTVNFDGNRLNDWSEICLSLAKFPTCVGLSLTCGVSESDQPRIPVAGSVDHLILSLNAIESIPPFPRSDQGTDPSALGGLIYINSLTLSSNNLRSWSDINALAKYCPILETLNITNNPIIEGQPPPQYLFRGPRSHLYYCTPEKCSRAISVAKLPVLKSLNGGSASPAQTFSHWTIFDVSFDRYHQKSGRTVNYFTSPTFLRWVTKQKRR